MVEQAAVQREKPKAKVDPQVARWRVELDRLIREAVEGTKAEKKKKE